jgi:hypothetical protein
MIVVNQGSNSASLNFYYRDRYKNYNWVGGLRKAILCGDTIGNGPKWPVGPSD